MTDSYEEKKQEICSDDSFASIQTLSFVSPHALGEHARKVRVVMDDHEVRLLAIEARDNEDRILASLMEAFDKKFASMMKGLQGQVLASRATNETRFFNLPVSSVTLVGLLSAPISVDYQRWTVW